MTANVATLHSRASALFGRALSRVDEGDVARPTPCADWDVRALVNHVVAEDLWTAPLLAGRTIAEIGDRFDGDVCGADPVAAFREAAATAVAGVGTGGALTGTVHLSFGDVSGEEYVWQLFVDHLVHAWDLARALGGDERLPADLVEAAAGWFTEREAAYRAAGLVAPRFATGDGADPQTRLLAAFGRDGRQSSSAGVAT
jgi:uncharacterized protein (TIGR03086 family)